MEGFDNTTSVGPSLSLPASYQSHDPRRKQTTLPTLCVGPDVAWRVTLLVSLGCLTTPVEEVKLTLAGRDADAIVQRGWVVALHVSQVVFWPPKSKTQLTVNPKRNQIRNPIAKRGFGTSDGQNSWKFIGFLRLQISPRSWSCEYRVSASDDVSNGGSIHTTMRTAEMYCLQLYPVGASKEARTGSDCSFV